MRADFYNSGTCSNRRAAAEQCIEMPSVVGQTLLILIFISYSLKVGDYSIFSTSEMCLSNNYETVAYGGMRYKVKDYRIPEKYYRHFTGCRT